MKLLLPIFILGVLCVSGLGMAQSPDRVVKATVDGMSCPICVTGVERSIKKLEWVARVKTNLKTGLVEIRSKPEVTIDAEGMKHEVTQAVKKSGFTVRKIEVSP